MARRSPSCHLSTVVASFVLTGCFVVLVRSDIVTSGRADVTRVRDLAHSVRTAGISCTDRYMDYVRGAYQIPSSLRSDRLFLVEASDATFVELVTRYLLDPTRPYPGFDDRLLRDVLVRTDAIRQWKTSYSLMCGTSICISFCDYSVLRGPLP